MLGVGLPLFLSPVFCIALCGLARAPGSKVPELGTRQAFPENHHSRLAPASLTEQCCFVPSPGSNISHSLRGRVLQSSAPSRSSSFHPPHSNAVWHAETSCIVDAPPLPPSLVSQPPELNSSCGDFSFTTASSTKKRKVVRAAETSDSQKGGDTTPSLHDGLASPRSSPTLTSNSNRPSSTSPPRYIPPHLHEEIREASVAVRQPVPELNNTGGLSPSEAYAGLSLEGQESDRESSGPAQKGAPPTISDNPRKASLRGYEPSQELQESVRQVPRASSPAKRPFSAMDPGAGKENMDLDKPQNNIPEPVSAAGSPGANPPSSSNPKAGEGRHVRATSVDMLGALNTTPSNSTPSPNHTSATSYTSDSSTKAPAPRDSEMTDSTTPPSFDEQFTEIRELVDQELQENQQGYALSSSWLARAVSRTSDGLKDGTFPKEAREGDVGPIDNSDIAVLGSSGDLKDERGQSFVALKPGTTLGQDMEMLPEEAWTKLVAWYGIKADCPIIRRYAHDTAPEGSSGTNLQWELHPPVLTIRKLRHGQENSNATSSTDANRSATQILANHNESFQKFLKKAKEQVGIPMTTKVKVWRVIENIPVADENTARSGMLTPATSRSGSPAPISQPQQTPNLLIDVNEFTNMSEGTQREMVDVRDETANDKYNGHLELSTVGLGTKQTLILEEQIGGPAGGEFVSENARSNASKQGLNLGVKNGAGKGAGKGTSASRGVSPAPSGPVTRGRTRRDGKTRGTVGLTNLGNSCYMNSGLQCIRSIEELSVYFLQGRYKEEINADNPLGHGGTLAKSYAQLLAGIYDDTNLSTFTPRNFKTTLGRLSSTFSGYQQQDSQEFLSFLVDGLHEDLNRIKKKPYVENPESNDDTHKDPKLIMELGEKFREGHRARNDSIAMDLFSGFYKNTMICPECDRVSITFDPYSLLTLQLPVEQTWQHVVTFVPLQGRPVQVEIDIDKNATIAALKDFVAKRFPGVKSNRLICAEIYSHKFYKVFEDRQSISENNIQGNDVIVLYELSSVPTNFPPPKKKIKKTSTYWDSKSSEEDIPPHESPLADRMLVPVYHRVGGRSTYSSRNLTLWPVFIVISREEAASYDEIMRKVIGRIATQTTADIFHLEDNFGGIGSNNSSDAVFTTEEDASSTTDPTVKANSVEGEGSIVDVTMTGTPEESSDQLPNPQDSSKTPEVLQPGAFIPGELQALFTMKHTKSSGKEMIQSGFNTIQGNEDYTPISERIPASRGSRRSSIQSQGSGSSGSSNTEDTQRQSPPQFSFNNGDQSDDSLPPAETFNQRRQSRKPNKFTNKKGRRQVGRKLKTYGKKGKQTRDIREDSAELSDPDSPPRLIRLGEAIILDWEPQRFDDLFGASSEPDDIRGTDTWAVREVLDDPDLVQKRTKRSQRKKHGVSLEDCFNETAKSEVLSEENAWYCNRCKELRRAEKTLAIWTAPDILVLHLKRFSSNRAFRDKLDVLVDFPIEGLDISQWVGMPEDKGLVYDLFAIDNHYGGIGGGHYTAYAQNFYDKRWYEYNDSSVSGRNPQSCITPAAYLLFYRRRSDKPLGPPHLQELVRQTWDPSPSDDQINAQSHDSSQGNGERARDLSLNGVNGSSSALAEVGAGRGSGRITRSAAQVEMDTMNMSHDEPDNTLPGYPDEGYDDENTGLQPLGVLNEASWSFANLGNTNGDDDNDSTRNFGGSDMGREDLNNRLIEDFGDDSMTLLNSGVAGQASPELGTQDETMVIGTTSLHHEDVIESMEYDPVRNNSDEEVVDIRVGKNDVKID